MAGYREAIQTLNARQTPVELLKASQAQGRTASQRSLWPYIQRLGLSRYVDQPGTFIHVAGSKGKGSTCSFADAIINEHRMKYGKLGKIGLYTSPHVVAVRERIRINSKPLSEEQFAQYFFEVNSRVGNPTDPTYFRFLTLMALYVFQQEGVDLAIFEVGVGGTHDATNVFTKPSVTAITSLGFDHIKTLGNDIEQIASHKAGILKQDCPCFTVPQEYDAALKVVRQRAEELNADLTVVEHAQEYPFLGQSGLSDYQIVDAALAIRISRCFLEQHHHLQEQLFHDKDRLIKILQDAQPPGRAQVKKVNGLELFLDGAHTQESLRAAVKWYSQKISNEKPRALVYSHNSLRDLKPLLQGLHGALNEENVFPKYVIFCGSKVNESEANSPDLTHVSRDLMEETNRSYWTELLREDDSRQVYCCESAEGAFAKLLSMPDATDIQVLVTGSLKLTGAVNALILQSSR